MQIVNLIFYLILNIMNNNKAIVFFDITKGKYKLGRIKIQLWSKELPKTCENFRQLCTGQYLINSRPTGYKQSCFYQITDNEIKGGDYIKNTGQSGRSIYEQNFYEEPSEKLKIQPSTWIINMIKDHKGKYSSLFSITFNDKKFIENSLQPFGQITQQSSIKILKSIVQIHSSQSKVPIVIYDCGEM